MNTWRNLLINSWKKNSEKKSSNPKSIAEGSSNEIAWEIPERNGICEGNFRNIESAGEASEIVAWEIPEETIEVDSKLIAEEYLKKFSFSLEKFPEKVAKKSKTNCTFP